MNSFRVNCLNFFTSAAGFFSGGLPLFFCRGVTEAEEENGAGGFGPEDGVCFSGGGKEEEEADEDRLREALSYSASALRASSRRSGEQWLFWVELGERI